MKKLLIVFLLLLGMVANASWKSYTIENKDEFGDILETRVEQVAQNFSTNFTDIDLYVKVTERKTIEFVYLKKGIKVITGEFKTKDDNDNICIFNTTPGISRGFFEITDEKEFNKFVKLLEENKTLKVAYKAEIINLKHEYNANSKIDCLGFSKEFSKIKIK